MPHQCTDCGRTFDDGSKEMLSGCPDCGGNKFQFHPDGVDDPPESEEPPEPPEPAVDSSVARTVGNAATAVRDLVGGDSSPPEPADADGAEPLDSPSAEATASSTAEPTPASERPDSWNAAPSAESPAAGVAESEDEAQASARSEVVSPDDLPPASETQGESARRDPPESASSRSVSSSGTPSSDPAGPTASQLDDPSEAGSQERPDLAELREELNEQFESIRVLEPGQYELNLMSLYDREEYIIALQEDGKYTIQVPERWEE